jgi:hypothetical protein
MNSHYDKLIAAFLSGKQSTDDKVEQELIDACIKDEMLLSELSDHVAFSRVVGFALQAKSDEQFIRDFKKRLSDEVNTKASFARSSHEELSNKDIPKIDSRNIHHIGKSKEAQSKEGKIWRFVIAASVAFFSIIFVFQQFYVSPSLGVVAKVVDAQSHTGFVSSGDTINQGGFSLTHGYAEITLNNGVGLLLEAPVQLNINSIEHVTLAEGSLVAKVPNGAEGFRVDTPSSQIVDLGTEFGVSVDKKGKSQVHVLTGEVKVRASEHNQYEHLTEDQARAYDLKQQVAIIKNQPHRFMRALPGKSIQNPDYLHWPLDREKGDVVSCQGKGINGKCFDGKRRSLIATKVGPEYVAGKFGDAIFFNGEDDWLETGFDGIGGSKPRTVAFWVKVPKDFAIEQGYGILSWGLADKLSAWQISSNPLELTGPIGRIRIGTNHAEIVGTTDLRDDQWHHVAIVLFGGEAVNLATHILIYLDGQLEKTATKSLARVFTELNHPDSRPLMMGRNMAFKNPKNTAQKFRFFKGWIDEVYIFDSALEQEKVQNLMNANQLNPN